MNRRNIVLSGLCAAAAVVAGCAPLLGVRPGASDPAPAGLKAANGVSPPAGSGPVVPAGGPQPGEPTGANKFELTGGQPVSVQAPPPGQSLQPPRALPAPPAPGGDPPPVAVGPGAPVPGDPHVRTNPTLNGGRLDLQPHEVPTDRVLELARQLELVLAQNRDLVARIRELERLGAGREQALVEAIREVESAEAEIAKTRGVIATQKSDLALLQDKIRQLEREDVELLKLVIAALEKLLPSGRREP